jgi:hypothetical protein
MCFTAKRIGCCRKYSLVIKWLHVASSLLRYSPSSYIKWKPPLPLRGQLHAPVTVNNLLSTLKWRSGCC